MKHSLKDLKARLVKARASHAYRVEKAVLEFTEDVTQRMGELNVKKSEFARRIDASPAYVTKILRGKSNFTFDSMVKIADGLDCDLSTHLTPRGMVGRWFDVTAREQKFIITTHCDEEHEFPENNDDGTTFATAA